MPAAAITMIAKVHCKSQADISCALLQAIHDLDKDFEHHKLPVFDAETNHVGDLIVTIRAMQAIREL